MVDKEATHSTEYARLNDPLQGHHDHPPIHLYWQVGVFEEMPPGSLPTYALFEGKRGTCRWSRHVVTRGRDGMERIPMHREECRHNLADEFSPGSTAQWGDAVAIRRNLPKLQGQPKLIV
jgi:hypothetical protein